MAGDAVKLARGAGLQLRVIYALILRETRTRFGQSQLGYLWALLEPLLWVATFVAMFTLGRRSAPLDMDLVDFLLTGIVPYTLFRQTANRVSASVRANNALLYFPQVQPIDLACARAALEFATGCTVFLVLASINAIVRRTLPSVDAVGLVALGLALCTLLGATLGLALCAAAQISDVVERLQGAVLRPLFWVSGLFFTAEHLPSNVRALLLWNPVFHGIELVRDGWFRQYDSRYASASYLAAWVLGLAFVGLAMERLTRHRIEHG